MLQIIFDVLYKKLKNLRFDNTLIPKINIKMHPITSYSHTTASASASATTIAIASYSQPNYQSSQANSAGRRKRQRSIRGEIVFQLIQNFASDHNFHCTISKGNENFPIMTSSSGKTNLDPYGGVLYENHYVIDVYKHGNSTIPRFICGYCEVVCVDSFCPSCANSVDIVISHHESDFHSRKLLLDSNEYSICTECQTCKIENTELCQTCGSEKINWIEWLVQQDSSNFQSNGNDHYAASDFLLSLFTFTYPNTAFFKSCVVKSFLLYTQHKSKFINLCVLMNMATETIRMQQEEAANQDRHYAIQLIQHIQGSQQESQLAQSELSAEPTSSMSNLSWGDMAELDNDGFYPYQDYQDYRAHRAHRAYQASMYILTEEEDELAIVLQRSRQDVHRAEQQSSYESSSEASSVSTASSEDQELCPICYDDMKGLDKNIVSLTCGHRYHFTCIFEQIKMMGSPQQKCGICRTGFGE